MSRSTDVPRERHPREKAGVLSVITFFFTHKIFLKGLRKPLQEEDIYEVLDDYRSEKLGGVLGKLWEKEAKKSKPSFTRVLWNAFGKTYASFGVIKLISRTFFMVSKPLLVGKIVSYFNPGQDAISKDSAYRYAATLAGILFLQVFVNNIYMLFVQQLAQKIRISISSLVYRKTLRLSSSSLATITNGRITTLMTKDVVIFESIANYMNDIWIGIVQILIMTYIMYAHIQWAAIFGVGFLVAIIPLQKLVATLTTKHKRKMLNKSDDRIHLIQEILPMMQTIKMYTWENYFSKLVHGLRKSEMAKLKILYYLKVAIISLGQLSIRISFFICITVYTYGVGNITAEKAFVVLGCYSSLQYVLNTAIPNGISLIAEARSSIERIKALLMAPEVDEIPHQGEGLPCIETKNLSARISDETILHGVNLHLSSGLHGLCGPVGSGKSTLLKVLLNELCIDEGSCNINGSVSYASQDPFLFNGTIQQNILFGLPFDLKRYEEVVKVCGLQQDIERFAKGDKTLLNDRGANLSKGQQARVNLARSVYRDADIYILDDPLSSIDSNLSKEIFTNCIENFLAKKLCLFVTGQSKFLKDCGSVIVMEAGTIKYHGLYDNEQLSGLEISGGVMEELLPIRSTQMHAEEIADKDEVDVKSKLLAFKDEKGKRKKKPTVDVGAYKAYFRFVGQYKVVGLFLWLCICQMCLTYFDYFICEWIKVEDSLLLFQSNNTNSTSHQHLIDARSKMPYIYSSLIATTILMTVGCSYVIFSLIATAHVKLHFASFTKILQAPASFFDANSCGNILNRFSKDVSIIDEQVPFLINECVKLGLMLIGLVALTFLADTRSIILPIVFVVPLYVCRSVYLPTSKSLKRLDGETKSPVIGHLSATLEGITTIRANKAQEIAKHEFDKYQNVHSSTAYMYMTASRAFAFVLDLVCAIYMVTIFSILMLKSGISAGIVGLVLTKTFELNSILQYGMRQWAELENQMTSVERVLEYTNVESEHEILKSKRTTPLPARGKVQFKNVHLRYPKTGELILKDINFTIEPGQKIGIVGRTGSGKSSMISALFRLYDLDSGAVLIDDRDVKETDVRILRSGMSVMPQNPMIFSGLLRANLDPEQEFTDADLWKALDEVTMKAVISNVDFQLDCTVGDRGSKFSTGEKQLICLARAINRKNNILVLDEATSSVDQDTSSLIEDAIRRNFSHCTIFMITHKLSSVLGMDKIMVVDNGTIVEFDYTNALLNDKNSTFYRLVSQSGLIK